MKKLTSEEILFHSLAEETFRFNSDCNYYVSDSGYYFFSFNNVYPCIRAT